MGRIHVLSKLSEKAALRLYPTWGYPTLQEVIWAVKQRDTQALNAGNSCDR